MACEKRCYLPSVWYQKVLLRHPKVILTIVSLVCISCGVGSLIWLGIPEFHDPKLGFEARGTVISSRLNAYDHLLEETVTDPTTLVHISSKDTQNLEILNTTVLYNAGNESEEIKEADELLELEESSQVDSYFCDIPTMVHFEQGSNVSKCGVKVTAGDYMWVEAHIELNHRPVIISVIIHRGIVSRKIFIILNAVYSIINKYNPLIPMGGAEYAKLVFGGIDDESLWTAEHMHSMCLLEETYVRELSEFHISCVHMTHAKRCCRSWSAGNYVALLANRLSCQAVTDRDVDDVLATLKECAPIFRVHMSIAVACWDAGVPLSRRCAPVPTYCRSHSAAIYHLLYHVVDTSFLHDAVELKYAISYLPVARGIGARRLYDAVESGGPVADGLTSIVAMDFGVKQELFDEYLLADLVWFCLALIAVTVAVCLYTRSIFITLSAFVFILFAVVVAYFIYGVLLRVDFFPFMNLLAVVVLLAIGVDDVFVYLSLWRRAKSERDTMTADQLVWTVVCCATPSALASSATTAAAFFAGGAATDVVVLRCFGLFAGLAVASHFLILTFAMPAVLRLDAQWTPTCSRHWYYHSARLRQCADVVTGCINNFVGYIIPSFVDRFRYVALSLCSILGVLSAVAIFVYPKLQLPTSSEFQLFAANHPLEVYDLRMKSQFWFSRSSGLSIPLMPLTVVWGIQPSHNLNRMDPLDLGSLEYDQQFEIGSPATRQFIMSFCRSLRRTRYYRLEPGMQLNNCFLENFERYMRRGCRAIDGSSLRPCCRERDRLPYNSSVFHRCILDYTPSLAKSVQFSSSHHAGLRFSRKSGRLVAIVVEFLSNEPFSLNYSSIGNFYTSMNSYVTEALYSAPEGLHHGFFVSYLDFYDLQNSLATGIPIATGLAVAVASGVALLVTLNLLVTVYAMLTVLASICVSVAALVCLGWRLNVVESVTVSVAAGLSVDFVLHHAVAYCLSTSQSNRRQLAKDAGLSVSAPVAMAAITTFLVGLCLIPSTIFAYRQIGIFLMILVVVSWLFTTFFFLPALCIAGPQGDFTQLRLCRRKSRTWSDKSGSRNVHAGGSHGSELSRATGETTATVSSNYPLDSTVSVAEAEHLTSTVSDSHVE